MILAGWLGGESSPGFYREPLSVDGLWGVVCLLLACYPLTRRARLTRDRWTEGTRQRKASVKVWGRVLLLRLPC